MTDAEQATQRIREFRRARNHWVDDPDETPIRSFTLPRELGAESVKAHLTDADLGVLLADRDRLAWELDVASRQRDYAVEANRVLIDSANRADQRAERAEAERDEARWLANHFRDAWVEQDPFGETNLGLLPDWVKSGGDAAVTRFAVCGPTPNGLMCACGAPVNHAGGAA